MGYGIMFVQMTDFQLFIFLSLNYFIFSSLI